MSSHTELSRTRSTRRSSRTPEKVALTTLVVILTVIFGYLGIPITQSLFATENIKETLQAAGCTPETANRIHEVFREQRAWGRKHGTFSLSDGKPLTEGDWTEGVCEIQNDETGNSDSD